MRYDAKAIGSGSEGAQNELQDSYNKVRSARSFARRKRFPSSSDLPTSRSQSMTLEEAQVLALKVLKQVMEEKLDYNNVQLAQVRLPNPSPPHEDCPSALLLTLFSLFPFTQVLPGTGFEILGAEALKAVIARTEA